MTHDLETTEKKAHEKQDANTLRALMEKAPREKQNSSAFFRTLVGVLLALVFLAILAYFSILKPQAAKYRREGARAQAEFDLRNCIREAENLYTLKKLSNNTELNCKRIPGSLFNGSVYMLDNDSYALAANGRAADVKTWYKNIEITCNLVKGKVNCTY